MAEHLTKSSNRNPKFGMCCLSGKIALPPLHPVPPELLQLITTQDHIGKSFRNHIRTYNNALAMTSIGCKIDESVNNGEEAVNDGVGPYVFKLHGELSHKAGSLLPPEGEPPMYAQLYVYNPADAVNYRMANAWNTHLDHHTMPPEQQCKIALHFNQSCNHHHYNLPDATNNEIAVILPGNGDQPESTCDIVLYCKYGPPLQCITDVHPLYPALHYVLLFSTGQLQWHPQIEYTAGGGANASRVRKHVSKSEFYCYCLHPGPPMFEPQHIFLSRKLFQEFICDVWATSEQDWLCWVMMNQDTICGEVYLGLADAVAANFDVDTESLG
jgi:hypothetical protein